jgi:hypothetical protein
MFEDTNDLDVSWIQEHEKLEKITHNYFREPLLSISIYSIYINSQSYIENIQCENLSLELQDKNSIMRKETILKFIQNKKQEKPNYKFWETLVYNVDLEPVHIQNYSKIENILEGSSQFFKKIPIIDDIVLPPSIFIFHSISAIYFLFRAQDNKISQIKPSKSILKKETPNSHKITKKVRISEDTHSYTKKYRDS